MKKVLKITGITIAAIVVLMAVLPFLFKNKIKEVIVKEGNAMIDARFDFGSLNISLFRDFPSVSATLRDFYVVGKERFETDTLVRAGALGISFDLSSLFGDSGYRVNSIRVENTMLNAIMLEDSTANWDIMKPADETQPEDSTAAAAFSVKLKKLTIKNLSLSYDDRVSKMYARVAGLDAMMAGDLSASRSTIALLADASGIDFRMGGIDWLRQGRFHTEMDVDADLENNKYTLKDNMFRLNAIEAGLDGWLQLQEDDAMDMDIKFSTPKISFKEILSLIPAIYARDFETVEAAGSVALEGWAKGRMQGDTLPAFDLNIKVADGTFRYPALPKGVEAINIAANVNNPGGSADLTVVNVNPFSFNMAGNPFSVTALIKTPVSDMSVAASAHGVLDLGMIKEVYPLDSMELNGVVRAGVDVAALMSDIEHERYENVKASGEVALADMLFKSAGMPDVQIKKSTLSFSQRYLELSQTEIAMGRNDFTIDCRVENYIAYAMKDQTLRGTLNLKSKYLNVNDFMGGETTETAADTSALSVIEVPRNLELQVAASMTKVIYDKLEIDNLAGQIAVSGGALDMKNLSMQTLGGAVRMSGRYSTANSVEQPEFGASFGMDGLSFAKTFSSFVTIQKIAPLFENLNGKFSGSMTLNTLLDKTMTPVLPSLQGKGSLATKDLSLAEVGVISSILDLARIAGVKDRKVKDLKVDFTIQDGKVRTAPFDIKMGDVSMNLSGTTSLDRTIDYTGRVQLPESALSAYVGSVNLKIGGTFASPQVSLDTKNIASQAIQGVVNNLLGETSKKLGVDLSDATKQKEALIKSAKDGGEIIMAEARKQADALTTKAGKDPISQLAAKKAAATMISQAQMRVDKMVEEATAKGDSIISRASR